MKLKLNLKVRIINLSMNNLIPSEIKSFEETKQYLKDTYNFSIKENYPEKNDLFLIYADDDCDLGLERIRAMNGAILEKNTNKIIAKCQQKILSESQFEMFFPGYKLEDLINNEDCIVSRQKEGTLMRVFFYNSEMYISTNKSINSAESRFTSSTSFRDLFQENCRVSLDNLSKDCTYGFLLHCQENTIVEKISENSCELVGVYDLNNPGSDISIFEPFESDENVDFALLKSQPFGTGRVVIVKVRCDGQSVLVKVESNEYIIAKNLRLGYKKINHSYLNSILKGNEKVFLKYFRVPRRREMREKLMDLASTIQDLYYQKFVLKRDVEFVEAEEAMNMILNIIHFYYYKKTLEPITTGVVVKILFEQAANVFLPTSAVLKVLGV